MAMYVLLLVGFMLDDNCGHSFISVSILCGYLFFFLATTTYPMDGTRDSTRRVFLLYLRDYLSGIWWFFWPGRSFVFGSSNICEYHFRSRGFSYSLVFNLNRRKKTLSGWLPIEIKQVCQAHSSYLVASDIS